ncbi:V-set domain containing T-cell activation inhibitor 1-like [Hyperolius riggenbachi]|uniref:V-set domain containing T-cell activation inhibitor 1-like n=1 Tax=Hyperolius riggenbachi TaxID=752182 RepID=UPI0035A292CA
MSPIIMLIIVGCFIIQSGGAQQQSTPPSILLQVSTSLYDSVQLPCSFPFVRGPEGLTVVWVKVEGNGSSVVVHKSVDGKADLREQDPQFTNRTELSKEITGGNLNLTLSEVSFRDEGTYICKAAHKTADGDLAVQLSISGLNANSPSIIFTSISGKRRLKFFISGVFQNPEVTWYNLPNTADLTREATQNITSLGDGRKMVESVLNVETTMNKEYFCYINEGRLSRRARAVISDGTKPVIIHGQPSGSPTMYTAWKISIAILSSTLICILIV